MTESTSDMARQKPLVTVTRKLPAPVEVQMKKHFDVRLRDPDTPMSSEELKGAVRSADVLAPTISDVMNESVIAAAGENLQLIASYGAGTNHIDLKAARDKGIVVTNTPGVLTDDTADIAMALILAGPRRVVDGARYLQENAAAWQGWAPTFFLLEKMLSQMDVVSINCPLTPETRRLLSAERLRLMKKTAWLINTARGEIVDENALCDMLEAGTLAGLGLDVYDGEPKVNPRLLALRNAVLLPHLGSATQEGRVQMGEKVIANIQAVLSGEVPPDLVSK
jgi:glyoxylate reductase